MVQLKDGAPVSPGDQGGDPLLTCDGRIMPAKSKLSVKPLRSEGLLLLWLTLV